MLTFLKYEEIVKYLIEQRTDVNQSNVHGDTALLCATNIGYEEIVKYLIEQGADVNQGYGHGVRAYRILLMKEI